MGRRTRMFLLKSNSHQGWVFFETRLLRLRGGRVRKVQRGVTNEAVWLSGRPF
jgi:hypothetical protein